MLNTLADTKGVRQSPPISANILTNTDSSMLVTAGGIISRERAGKNVDMGASGKLNERISFSVIHTCNKIDPAVAALMAFGSFQAEREDLAFDMSDRYKERLASFNGL